MKNTLLDIVAQNEQLTISSFTMEELQVLQNLNNR